jgi:plasmid stabilization system protein ParE
MAASLAYTQQAEDDVAEAHDWYEQQQPGLGATFLTRVEACTTSICRTPKIGRPYATHYRRALVRRFPYAVIYRYDDATDAVTIHAVFHTSRDPDDLLRRLP